MSRGFASALFSRRVVVGNVLIFLLIATLCAIKGRAFFPDGRLWAEEGTLFFPAIEGKRLLEALSYVYHGHLEIVANFVLWCGSLAAFRWMPAVVTYLSLIFQLVPVVLLMLFRRSLGIRAGPFACWTVVYVGLPQSAEVFATATNLHFHLSFLVAVILIIPITENYPRWLMRLLLFIAGLGGVPPNALLPLFVFKAATKGADKERWMQVGVLSVTLAVQVVLLLSHPGEAGPRSVGFNPWLVVLAAGAQQVLGPLVGLETGDIIATAARGALHSKAAAMPLAGMLAVAVFLLYRSIYRRGDTTIHYMVAAAVLLVCLGCVATLGDKDFLVSSWFHGRYFFVPNLLVFLAISILISKRNVGEIRYFFYTAVAVSGFLGVQYLMLGPPWSEAYRACRAELQCTQVAIWPDGWHVSVRPSMLR